MKKVKYALPCILALILAGSGFGQWKDIERVHKKFAPTGDDPLEIVLNVDAGEIRIERGNDRVDVDLEMAYTADQFRDRIDFNERRNRLSVELKARSWKKVELDEDENKICRVTLKLPYGVDLYFDSKLKAGEIDMDLTGIRLREFTMVNWAGEVFIGFDEPNPVKMDMLDIDAKVGSVTLSGLGNARFTRADINGGIGELEADFSGALLPGAVAKIDLDIGEAVVYFPEDVGIKMSIGGMFSFLSSKDIDPGFRKRGRSYYNDLYEDDEDGFLVRITPGLGELSVHLE